jgi:hypothetical protein
MMPPSGTFEYAFDVPKSDRFTPAKAHTVGTKAPLFRRDHLRFGRLVGYQPEAWIQEDVIMLLARTRRFASCRAASVGVHRDVIALIKEGDSVHLSRTACGGLAFALVRRGALVLAVGALTDLAVMPKLGVQCQIAGDSDSAPPSGTVLPVQVVVSGKTHRLRDGERLRVENFQVECHHGFAIGLPGLDASISVVNAADFNALVANEAAPLLTGFTLVRWPRPQP